MVLEVGDECQKAVVEKEVQQMLQGCTFTKDQYDHILKIVQQKSHAPTVSNATLLVQQSISTEAEEVTFDVALRVIRYMKRQSGQGLLLSSSSDGLVTTFCDTDWASCVLTRKSVTGYMVKVGQSLVSWKTKKQTTVSKSSVEAEYRSLASTVLELVWFLGLLKEVGAELHS
uniref:Reverse transcriptase Ty1/copia-type domain-containing protein n=1 Tax=Solanum lycopersicum TaxID=4081 RepID=A0A3Q7G520_SOLLC